MENRSILADRGVTFNIFQTILLDKNSYGKWRSFNEQEKVDILVLGNSHADNGIGVYHMAENIKETYGGKLIAFNYALYGMRI